MPYQPTVAGDSIMKPYIFYYYYINSNNNYFMISTYYIVIARNWLPVNFPPAMDNVTNNTILYRIMKVMSTAPLLPFYLVWIKDNKFVGFYLGYLRMVVMSESIIVVMMLFYA